MLRSSARRIRKQPIHPFDSIFEVDLLLQKISGLLNSRPIFANDTGLVTISDILHPRISSGEAFDILENDLLVKDAMFKSVWNIFCEEVVAGALTKTGKKSHVKDPSLEVGSIVLVLFPSRNRWKYGKIIRVVSQYRYEVLLKYGKLFKGQQVIDRSNIVFLFKSKSETQKEG